MLELLRLRPEGPGLVAESPRIPLRLQLRRLGPQLRPHRASIAVLLAVAAALPAIEAVEIWLFQRVVDDVLVPVALDPLMGLAMAYVGLALGSGLLGWIDAHVGTWVAEHLTLDTRRHMLERIHAAPSEVVDRARSGDLLTRLTHDSRSVAGLLLGGVVEGVAIVARLLFFTGALLLLDWQLALVALLVAPVFWWSTRRFARRLKSLSRQRRRRAGSMASVAEESISSLSLVQVHGRQREELARFEREGRAILAAELAAARVRATYPIVIDLLELVGLLAVIALGTWAQAQGRLTLGGLLVFLTYLSQLYRPVRQLGDLGASLASDAAGVERVMEVLDLPVGPSDRPDPVVLADVRGTVTVERVTHAYPGRDAPAVRDVSFQLHPGQLVALAGPSGAGKSTILRLVARLSDPGAGRILLDGVDLRDLSLRQVRDSITVLLQDAPVLDASVRENVAFARPGADDDAIWAALRRAGVADVVAGLPAGLDTAVGRAGRSLSGGQGQRLALARALLADPRVLVLDEPTTGLDAPAARRVVDTLMDLARERSVVVASHDPLVLAAADVVVEVAAPEAGEPGRDTSDVGAGATR